MILTSALSKAHPSLYLSMFLGQSHYSCIWGSAIKFHNDILLPAWKTFCASFLFFFNKFFLFSMTLLTPTMYRKQERFSGNPFYLKYLVIGGRAWSQVNVSLAIGIWNPTGVPIHGFFNRSTATFCISLFLHETGFRLFAHQNNMAF